MDKKFLEVSQISDRSKKVKTIDSREVAEMLGKEHSYVLEMIQGRDGKLGIIPVLENASLAVSNYFIPSTYKAGTRKYKCYLVTKMGCELLGNKQQGEKGILFTAKYVERFNEMENVIQNNLPIGMEAMQGMGFLSQSMAAIGQHVQVLTKFTMNMKEYFQDSIQAKDHQIDQAMDLIGIRCKNTRRLTNKLKDALFNHYGEYVPATDIRYIAARDKVFKEFKVYKWEDIPVGKYNAVEAFILEVITD